MFILFSLLPPPAIENKTVKNCLSNQTPKGKDAKAKSTNYLLPLSSSLLLGTHLVHVGYWKESNNLLVIGLPAER